MRIIDIKTSFSVFLLTLLQTFYSFRSRKLQQYSKTRKIIWRIRCFEWWNCTFEPQDVIKHNARFQILEAKVAAEVYRENDAYGNSPAIALPELLSLAAFDRLMQQTKRRRSLRWRWKSSQKKTDYRTLKVSGMNKIQKTFVRIWSTTWLKIHFSKVKVRVRPGLRG